MKLIDNIVYLTYDECVACGFNERTLWNGKSQNRKGWEFVKDPVTGLQLVSYEAMRKKYQKQVQAKYGDPYKYYAEQQSAEQAGKLIDSLTATQDDVTFFASLVHDDGRTIYTGAQINDLALASATCSHCTELLTAKSKDFKEAGYKNGGTFWQSMGVALAERVFYPQTRNGRKFKALVQKYDLDGRAALVNGRIGNQHGAKLLKAGKDWLVAQYSNPRKPSFTRVTRMYNEQAKKHGWKQVCEATVRNYLMDTSVQAIWNKRRHGKKVAKKIQPQASRMRASYFGALYSVDGTALQLVNCEGYKVPYLVYVWDCHTEMIVGVGIGERENGELVRSAITEAIRSQDMVVPFQWQYDGGSANVAEETKALFDATSHVHFAGAAYQPQGRRAEQMQGRFEQSVLRDFKNFKGGNITSHSVQGKANPDYIVAQKEDGELPTLPDTIRQLRLAISVWNNRPGKRDGLSPIQRKAASLAERTPERVDAATLLTFSATRRPHTVSYTTAGIETMIDGELYKYWVEDSDGVGDFAFQRQYLGKNFWLHIDRSDLGKVLLYDEDDKLVAMATSKVLMPEAVADYKPGDAEYIKRYLEKRDDYLAGLDAETAQCLKEAEQISDVDFNFYDVNKDHINEAEARAQAHHLKYIGDTEYYHAEEQPAEEDEEEEYYELKDIDEPYPVPEDDYDDDEEIEIIYVEPKYVPKPPGFRDYGDDGEDPTPLYD